MADVFALTRDDATRIKRCVQAYEGGKLTPGYQGQPRPLPAPVETWIAQSTSTITAFSGSTLGSGSAELYSINTTSGSMVDQSLNITVWNLSQTTISSGTNLLLSRDPISGGFCVSQVFGAPVCVPYLANFGGCVGGSMMVETYYMTFGAGFSVTTSGTPCP